MRKENVLKELSFATNSDILNSIFLQPMVYINGLRHHVEKEIGMRKSEFVGKTQFHLRLRRLTFLITKTTNSKFIVEIQFFKD